jgi:replicative DNA helicase
MWRDSRALWNNGRTHVPDPLQYAAFGRVPREPLAARERASAQAAAPLRKRFDGTVTDLAVPRSGGPTGAIVPPQNLEAEESVLGAMLLSPTAIGAVTEVLDGSDFYRESHGVIYRGALALYGKGEPVDAITLSNELDERGELERVGGSAKIAELAALVPSTSNAEHYARIVKEMATLRGLVRVGQEIQRLGQDRPGQTTDLVDRAEQMVFELAQERVTGDFAHINDLLKESFARIMHLYEAGVDITGIPSGFRELD